MNENDIEFTHFLRWHIQRKVPHPLRENYDFLFSPWHRFDEVVQALWLVQNAPVDIKRVNLASFFESDIPITDFSMLQGIFEGFEDYLNAMISFGEREHRSAHTLFSGNQSNGNPPKNRSSEK